ncbi:flagellar basal body P-ring formation chaperone FlgA [Polaromonas sp.]|uniref:flagellar basal body P-ring formation chaperone FlgA n=1 Tax=Polaromonas sp. TaxID=1869339 RepID=UPI003567745F
MLHKKLLRALSPAAPTTRSRASWAVPQIATLLLLALAAISTPASGEGRLPTPLAGSARPVIEQFLTNQTSGLPGKVSISIDTPRSGALPPCELLEPFLPARARPWGRVSVGVRCISDQPWTRYLPAYIAVVGSYHIAARAISAGQTLEPADTSVREGDLTALPASVVTDPSQLLGMTASNSIAAGAPIRRELLRGVVTVHQGQSIKVLSRGAGFVVSAEGKAMTDAALGAMVQVKLQGGQLLGGIVRPNGIVERFP